MAITQFPKEQYFRTLNSDQVTRMGYFNLATGTEITFVTVWAFVRGIIASPFQIRMNVYGNNDQAVPIFSSSWATLSAATLLDNSTGAPYSNNWLGYFNLDFAGYPLNPNINYYVSMETSGYTRNLDTFYIGINLDWYSPTNNQLDAPDLAGIRFAINGYRP